MFSARTMADIWKGLDYDVYFYCWYFHGCCWNNFSHGPGECRNWALGDAVTVNDFYEFLGLCGLADGDNMGWDWEMGISWLDFNHRVIHKNGEKVLVIEMVFTPDKVEV